MKVQKWHVVDIHYNDDEEEQAKKYGDKLKNQGYTLEALDDGHENDNCDQWMKFFTPITKTKRSSSTTELTK